MAEVVVWFPCHDENDLLGWTDEPARPLPRCVYHFISTCAGPQEVGFLSTATRESKVIPEKNYVPREVEEFDPRNASNVLPPYLIVLKLGKDFH